LLVLGAIVWLVFGPDNWDRRKAQFAKAGERGMVVVNAIEAYRKEHGYPPQSLEALVPRYLKNVPGTGLREYPSYEYQVFTNSKASLVWYDLGSRHGKPRGGLWVYNDGDPEHAILVLTLDQHERVVEAYADRMPKEHETVRFDVEKWRRNDSRIEMVRSLPNHISFRELSLAKLTEILGEPSGTRMLRNSPWELRIECSRGIINWDVFFYWPTQDYPTTLYGGGIERIGNWAYVHE
jgi:hypothetical protein